MEQQIVFIFRMIIASCCGLFIGLERKNRSKEAGVRTHSIVALASCLMMLISKYGFFDIVSGTSFDGTRIAAQIVSGIGFLGAGMIFVHKNNITGLTTAAGMWATAGIGMAFGAGMYVLGLFSTFIILIIQFVLHRSSHLSTNSNMMTFSLYSDNSSGFQKRLYKELESMNIHIYSADVSNDTENGRFYYMLTIDLPEGMCEEDLVSKYENSRICPMM